MDQTAKDVLEMTRNQRNNAQNECVELGAQLLAARRKIAELEGNLKSPDEPELPLSNGHASAEIRP